MTNNKLTLALALNTDLTATVDADGAALSFTRSDGTTALRYTGLTVFDATGKELRAWLELLPSPQWLIFTHKGGK